MSRKPVVSDPDAQPYTASPCAAAGCNRVSTTLVHLPWLAGDHKFRRYCEQHAAAAVPEHGGGPGVRAACPCCGTVFRAGGAAV
jgi:hypothetical protein